MIAQTKPSMMVEFLKRVQNVIWNRKFLVAKEKARFGLAPKTAEEGDSICILHGCSVPVILRQHVAESDNYFELIGEAYVHGLMDGEAMDAREGKDPDEFKLR